MAKKEGEPKNLCSGDFRGKLISISPPEHKNWCFFLGGINFWSFPKQLPEQNCPGEIIFVVPLNKFLFCPGRNEFFPSPNKIFGC